MKAVRHIDAYAVAPHRRSGGRALRDGADVPSQTSLNAPTFGAVIAAAVLLFVAAASAQTGPGYALSFNGANQYVSVPNNTLSLTACTISGNMASLGGGISGPCTLRNTLIALNNGSDINGPVTSLGHNLIGANYAGSGITNGVNSDLTGNPPPVLGLLGPYGGPTFTIALAPGSLAVDAGDDALLSAPFNLTTDQRGLPRKVGAHVDIGAFELLTGDLNYDGVVDLTDLNILLGSYNNGAVDQSALNAVLARYWPNSPWLYMTNTAGLGGTNVTFALTNSTAGAFCVLSSTDLLNWQFLGPATPRYLFTDTNAPSIPQRYYRLRYP